MTGQVVWVTGAGTGIGRAVALNFAARGARVALMGRRAALLEEVAAEVRAAGGEPEAVPLDVADRAAVEAAGARLLSQWGRVDVLVNNAGTNVSPRTLETLAPDDWDRVVAVNLTGAYNLAHAALPAMRRQGGGVVVSVASIAGIGIFPLAGAAYTAAKHGMVALSKMIQQEEAPHGIRACAINPGEVNSPLLDLRPVVPPDAERARMLQPEDVAAAVAFVAGLPARASVPEMTLVPTHPRDT